MNPIVSTTSGPPLLRERPLVLVADDNEDNLLLLTHTLDLFGISHISTLAGRSAIQLVAAHQPDLLLLDIMLPDLSGVEVIRHLRQNPATQHVPIVAVTALADDDNQEYLIQLGCDGYLSKPYNLDDLEMILRVCLKSAMPAF